MLRRTVARVATPTSISARERRTPVPSDENPQANSRFLAVVGASAGGVDALSVLAQSLRPDFGAPLVVAQHLDPHRESHLREVLQLHTRVPVRLVTDRATLEPGVIYVVSANRHIAIE